MLYVRGLKQCGHYPHPENMNTLQIILFPDVIS